VATAYNDPNDREWTERIAHHRARRPAAWRIVETSAPGAPSLESLLRAADAEQTLVIDSTGTWLAERMRARLAREANALDEAALESELAAVTRALTEARAYVIVVGDEAGWGIVPEYPSGRVFRDVLGRAQQALAAAALRAYVVVAGVALDLHALGRPV
jgi:adenosylcobinamide kinase/adenosylcobinamide-phosphate guanylyltransferase